MEVYIELYNSIWMINCNDVLRYFWRWNVKIQIECYIPSTPRFFCLRVFQHFLNKIIKLGEMIICVMNTL